MSRWDAPAPPIPPPPDPSISTSGSPDSDPDNIPDAEEIARFIREIRQRCEQQEQIGASQTSPCTYGETHIVPPDSVFAPIPVPAHADTATQLPPPLMAPVSAPAGMAAPRSLTSLLHPVGELRSGHLPIAPPVPVPANQGARPSLELYRETLTNMCADNLSPRRCYHPDKCIPSGKIHKCIKWPDHGCDKPFIHYLWVHSLAKCPNKNAKDDQRDCGKKHVPLNGSPPYSCFQLITVAHIKSTCKKIQLKGVCWIYDGLEPTEEEREQHQDGGQELPGCKYGHDMRVIRLGILRERNELSAQNALEHCRQTTGGSSYRGNDQALAAASLM